MQLPNIPLSSDTKRLIRNVTEPIKRQYVKDRYAKNELRWLKQYNMIKDPGWPVCSSYQDFDLLPDWVKNECENQHGFSPEILYDAILRDSDAKFAVPDSLIFNDPVSQFLCTHRDVIENKKIVDFACGLGHYSFLAQQLNCKNITGTNIRSDSIDIANATKKDLLLTDDQINFRITDIHNYQANRSLCRGKDTAFLLGIMYHVHDHFAIMESIFDTELKHVVLQTGIFEDEKPIIWWKREPTFELTAGWYNHNESILVGYPSIAWLDMVAEQFGFARKDTVFYKISNSVTRPQKFLRPFAAMLFESLIR